MHVTIPMAINVDAILLDTLYKLFFILSVVDVFLLVEYSCGPDSLPFSYLYFVDAA